MSAGSWRLAPRASPPRARASSRSSSRPAWRCRRSKTGASSTSISAADGVGDLPLRRVVLEVDRPLGETVEPAAQRVAVQVTETEHAPEPEHGDRLEVLAHQLCLAASHEPVEQLGDKGLDQVRGRWPRRPVGAATDRASPGAASAARRRGAGCSRRPSSARAATDRRVRRRRRGRVAACSTSAQRVTNQRPTAGTKQTGASSRSRA